MPPLDVRKAGERRGSEEKDKPHAIITQQNKINNGRKMW